MLTRGELRGQVQNLIQRPDSSYQTKINGYLNTIQRGLVSLRPWLALLRPLQVSTTSGQDYIITPSWVEEIIDLHQRQTPAIIALQRYYANLHRSLDSLTQRDSPVVASPMGEVGVLAALPSTGTITVESSDNTDSTQVVTARGYNSLGLPVVENITLNGTSAVTSSNSFLATEGYEPSFSKADDTVGHVIIKRSSTVIAYLGTDEREARYRKWKLWPVPSAAITLYATVKKRVPDMDRDTDVPGLECDNILIKGAFAMALEQKRQMSKAAAVWGKVDLNGAYPPGTYMAEVDALIQKEPKFSENFQEQFLPEIHRGAIDMPLGFGGYQLRGQ